MALSDLLCVRCRRLMHEADDTEEELLAGVRRYCASVAARSASLAAADRYYHALMEYQWRLNALEVQLHAVEAARGDPELRTEGASDGSGGVAPSSSDAEAALRRHAALRRCLEDIEQERALAVSALEERASHYALSVSSSATAGGAVDRFATSEAERQSAIERYRQLAGETFAGVAREAGVLLQVTPGDDGLRQLHASLERRRGFWHAELDTTWAAWHDITEEMHRAGDEAVAAWEDVAEELDAGRRCADLQKGAVRLELRRALAAFAARALEVELLSTPALSGLYPERAWSEGGISGSEASHEGTPRSGASSAAARRELLGAVLELLRGLGSLHEVGESLLSQDAGALGALAGAAGGAAASATPLGRDAQAAAPTPSTPLLRSTSAGTVVQLAGSEATPTAGDAVRLAAAAQVTPAAAARHLAAAPECVPLEEREGVRGLLPWLAECLVEALCEAARQRDHEKVDMLIRLCVSLGREGLSDAIGGAAARRRAHRNQGNQVARFGDADRADLPRLLKELAAEALSGAAAAEEPDDGPDGEELQCPCPCPRKCGRSCCGLAETQTPRKLKLKPVPAA